MHSFCAKYGSEYANVQPNIYRFFLKIQESLTQKPINTAHSFSSSLPLKPPLLTKTLHLINKDSIAKNGQLFLNKKRGEIPP